ncbi:MAG TPA: hypothetical protein VFD63_26110 [Pyrinomonadaceae bacterium]|jgi:hypothetical protein|nr:hypothetical protein [Pyrinomonadaceae bacterium]
MLTDRPTFGAIAPCFPVSDVGATIRWYQLKLGFWGDAFPESEPYVFAILSRDNIEIMLQRVENFQKPDLYFRRGEGVWDAYIRTSGVKKFWESVRENVTIVKPLRQQPYGAWEFEVKDLNGYILVFSEIIDSV